MTNLVANDFLVLLTDIFIILLLGNLLGELAKKFNFPAIVGELFAGIILGPTFLEKINLDLYQTLFPTSGLIFHILEFLFQLSLILIMFTSGLEIDLRSIIKQKKVTLLITAFGIAVPFLTGMAIARVLPNFFLISDVNCSSLIFQTFMGTAFAIAALPVIAKILMDTQIIQTPTGIIIISSAVLTDVIGWFIFSFITQSQEKPTIIAIPIMGLFFTLMITPGNKLLHVFLKKIKNTPHWINIILGLCLCICLFFTILSELLSLHSCLGAFLSGIALKDVIKNYKQVKLILNQFISSFFSPLFFVSIGLRINFLEDFNPFLIIIIFIFASLSKVGSVYIGAYFSGIKRKEAFIISIALNARGAMEIVFSTIALNLGIISKPIHIALVTMALLTSIISGILIKKYCRTTSSASTRVQ